MQHTHGAFAILHLRALVLAGHYQSRGKVGDAHGRGVLLHVLSAGAGRAVNIDAQIFRVDLDGGHVRGHIRGHFHLREGGVAAVGRIERRKAHQPVHAFLGSQEAIGQAALDRNRNALDAGFFAFGQVQNFGLKMAALDPAQVHALQHGRPVIRLGAARAGTDGQ